ncbi:MAG: glutathione peroxidase [Lutibacter sp.]|nr:MAG: glutathione peroxidase [Lutibacter sp.]
MKRGFILLCITLSLVSCKDEKKVNKAFANHLESRLSQNKENIYQFSVKDLSGTDFNFADLKGSKIMIVNTASKCGLTPQYKQLQELYDTYKDQNFTIVGFPANNFLWQEPGTDSEIATFCKENFGVTFPMMNKISVKGKDMHEVYKFLTQKNKNGLEDSKVSWNFQKYLLNENGEVVRVISPKTLPNDPSIIEWIEN